MDNLTETSPSGAMAAAAADLTGQTLDEFHLLRKLGQGGMGQVYLAEQKSLKRKVALKLLRPDLAANAKALERFKLEAEAVARVTHANIVQVYAVSPPEAARPYMALEYVEGRNLRDYLARKGPPEVLLALSIMRQVASALQRAGELGIVHRDIKPDNILLTKKGEVKVADFGLSRCLEGEQPALHLTASGVTMGTPLYMSPEQVEGKPVDPRTDIYSFGVTSYHMLAGEPPFRGTTAFEVALQHVRSEPAALALVRPDLPPELCAVVHKMMAKDPDQRYQTGRELLKDLARVRDALNGVTGFVPLMTTGEQAPLAGALAPQPSSGRVPVAQPPPRPRRWVRTAFVLSLLAALSFGVGLGVLRQQRIPAPVEEEGQGEVGPAADATPLQKREQQMTDLLEQEIDPAKGTKDPSTGVRLCLSLSLPQLEQRPEEADRLFTRLATLQHPTYQTLGVLGQAIVRALKGQAAASNHLFKTLQARPPGDPKKFKILNELLRTNKDLTRWTVEAAFLNHANGVSDKEMAGYLGRYLHSPKRTDGGPRGGVRKGSGIRE